ncbi:hypothetical protein [Haladaptatus salinisoli]|uniref:hypothetical protein n=1 Tax=Haladaptatus salinisoli TaxID=2884876 RepID=UPI001D0B3C7C|nr:hypothetical protein [Haladaptatus salinisoli]
MTDHSPHSEVILSLEATDLIQVTTKRTLTGVIYNDEHTNSIHSHRGPEPGHYTLLFAAPSNDLYRLTCTYYIAYDHTQHQLDRYEFTSTGKYARGRTHATIETVTRPNDNHATSEYDGHESTDATDAQHGGDR